MKAKKLRRIVEAVLAERETRVGPEVVTFKTIEVSFVNRTITVNGATHPVATDAVSIPLLDGSAAFLPGRGWERIA